MILLIVVLQSGCKRSTTAEPAKPENAASTGTAGVEIEYKSTTGEDVRFAGGEQAVALSANFPTDVAVYPKATVVMVAVKDDEAKVMAKTADPLQKVKEFYDEKLKSDGWGSLTTIGESPPLMLEGTKKGRTLLVLLSGGTDGRTLITLTVSKDLGTK